MLITASLFLEALEGPPEAREERQREVARVATRQLRLIGLGRHHWLD
jgi:hypothetical protein